MSKNVAQFEQFVLARVSGRDFIYHVVKDGEGKFYVDDKIAVTSKDGVHGALEQRLDMKLMEGVTMPVYETSQRLVDLLEVKDYATQPFGYLFQQAEVIGNRNAPVENKKALKELEASYQAAQAGHRKYLSQDIKLNAATKSIRWQKYDFSVLEKFKYVEKEPDDIFWKDDFPLLKGFEDKLELKNNLLKDGPIIPYNFPEKYQSRLVFPPLRNELKLPSEPLFGDVDIAELMEKYKGKDGSGAGFFYMPSGPKDQH